MKAAWLRWTLGAAVVLFIVYDTQNFFRAEIWSRYALWTAIPAGLGLGSWYLRRNLRSVKRPDRLWMVIAAPAAAFGVVWLLIGHCIPARLTAFFGEPVTLTTRIEAVIQHDTRFCQSRIHGRPFDAGLFDFFCANREMLRKLPAMGYAEVIGKRSWFGFHAIEVVPHGTKPTP